MSEKMDEQLKLAMEHTIEQIGPDEEQTDEIWRGVQERAQHKTKKFPVCLPLKYSPSTET